VNNPISVASGRSRTRTLPLELANGAYCYYVNPKTIATGKKLLNQLFFQEASCFHLSAEWTPLFILVLEIALIADVLIIQFNSEKYAYFTSGY